MKLVSLLNLRAKRVHSVVQSIKELKDPGGVMERLSLRHLQTELFQAKDLKLLDIIFTWCWQSHSLTEPRRVRVSKRSGFTSDTVLAQPKPLYQAIG